VDVLAIVTGSSSGIGKAIAQELLAGGWSVAGFDIAAAAIDHAQHTHVRVDLCDGDATVRAAASLSNVAALVHAAGVLRVGSLGNLDARDGELMWRLHVESVTRIDKDGARHPLAQGDLSAVDAWNWSAPNVLRWRSRLPSDPPFEQTELVYEIAYRLSGILQKQGGNSYILDNDFAFPDRDWPVDAFTLSLALDPVWKPQVAVPETYHPGGLPGKQGFVVKIQPERVITQILGTMIGRTN